MGQNFQQSDIPPPDHPAVEKDWHKQIPSDQRSRLIGKLFKALCPPSPDSADTHDQRIKYLITFAWKVEKEMFETANDKEMYYHLLAEKIYKIKKELQEKNNRRLNEQQMSGRQLDSVGYEYTGQQQQSEPQPNPMLQMKPLMTSTPIPVQTTHKGNRSSGIITTMPIKRVHNEEPNDTQDSVNSDSEPLLKQMMVESGCTGLEPHFRIK